MNLLLLLSALLSALGGVGQAVRGVREPQAVCASVARYSAAATQGVTAGVRPRLLLPRPADAAVSVLASLRLTPSEPIFAGRRRE